VVILTKGQWKSARTANAPFRVLFIPDSNSNDHHEKKYPMRWSVRLLSKLTKLERFTGIVGTIEIRPFISGSLGQCWGSSGHFMILLQPELVDEWAFVIGGVAEALVWYSNGASCRCSCCHCVQLFLRKRLEHFINDMELCASELIDLIVGNKIIWKN